VTDLPLPIEDSTYDLIVLDNVLEHLPNDEGFLESLFKEFSRVLRSGGRVRIRVPYFRSPAGAGHVGHSSNGYSSEFGLHYISSDFEEVYTRLLFPRRLKYPHGFLLQRFANRFQFFYEYYLAGLFPAREVETVWRC